MSIYITGDTHASIDIVKLYPENFKEQTLMPYRKDFLIICGDFGAIWGDEEDARILRFYRERPWITLFCDGNHENFDKLYTYPEIEWKGGKVHMIASNIFHLMRGQSYNIEGKTFFVMGGAASHDKWMRQEGVSWWAQEMPNDAEYETAFETLDRVNWKADYVITHCAPDHVQDMFGRGYEHDKLTNFLEVVSKDLEFKHWYFGHYHTDTNFEKPWVKEQVNGNYTAIYDRIEKLED